MKASIYLNFYKKKQTTRDKKVKNQALGYLKLIYSLILH